MVILPIWRQGKQEARRVRERGKGKCCEGKRGMGECKGEQGEGERGKGKTLAFAFAKGGGVSERPMTKGQGKYLAKKTYHFIQASTIFF